MKIKRLNTKNLSTGFLYFYVHFVTEAVCFYVLSSYIESPPVTWLITFAYDMLAFAPQSIIGYINDKFPKISFGLIGSVMLAAAVILQEYTSLTFVSLVILCLGNACIHVNGAEVTLRTSKGSLSHSAIFVSGGSFGVISGKLLGTAAAPPWLLLILILTSVPFMILAQMYLKDKDSNEIPTCQAFQYNNPKINKCLIIILSVFVVIIRGYMAYGIPTSWKKTTLQTVILFVFMGIGKALGGVFADLFGVKKVAIFSVLAALPFLLLGDNNMFVSLIGVMFFSMTMSVSLAVLVSVFPKTPGLAFGFTTIGLFLGAVPVFFFKITDFTVNCIMLSVMTVICLVCLFISIRKDESHEFMD
ncbi:MAG: hypothetical protein ACI4GC_08990 [Acutalibacteraceae bacterium]